MELVEIGSVRKAHGYRGEIKLSVGDRFGDDIRQARFCFIGVDRFSAIPYEIANMRGGDWICHLDGITSKESAAALRGLRVYLKTEDVKEEQLPHTQGATEAQFARFVGFALIDTERGEIGAIDAVDEDEFQARATVHFKGKRVLVPLNHDLVRGVDFTKRIVFVGLPEGLLEL